MFAAMTSATASNTGRVVNGNKIATADVFEYLDPVDASISKNQGIRFLMEDGSRVIFRLSGTAGSGATVRMYIEKYVPPTAGMESLHEVCADVVGDLVQAALELSSLVNFTGMESPTVIT